MRITDEGSVPEMRIWSILLIKSDLKWCIHLSRSLFLYLFARKTTSTSLSRNLDSIHFLGILHNTWYMLESWKWKVVPQINLIIILARHFHGLYGKGSFGKICIAWVHYYTSEWQCGGEQVYSQYSAFLINSNVRCCCLPRTLISHTI